MSLKDWSFFVEYSQEMSQRIPLLNLKPLVTFANYILKNYIPMFCVTLFDLYINCSALKLIFI